MIKLNNDVCPFCGSSNAHFKKNVHGNLLFECQDCTLQFFSPRKFNKDVYEGEKIQGIYESYHSLRKQPTIWLLELIKTIKNLNFNINDKLILEIGAGDALNYEYLKQNFKISSNNYEILEVDSKSVAAAKKRGITTAYTQFFDESFANQNSDKYDILIITEVIEHQDNLNSFLENAFKILKKDGLIFITTPNRERVFIKIGERTDMPPHHFLRYNKNFFIKNFKNQIQHIGYYFLDHNNLLEYTRLLSKSKFSTRKLWIIFYPLLILKAIFAKLLNYGEGLVVVLKK